MLVVTRRATGTREWSLVNMTGEGRVAYLEIRRQNGRFFLKISKETRKSWRKSYTP